MTGSAVIFGAGSVGRGFLGQLFSESGYEVVFVDVDATLIAALNARGGYTIHLVENDWAEKVTVSPVRALHSEETDAVAGALAEAGIAATAVGVRALPHIAPLVAAGVARRAKRKTHAPLNILICENMKDAAATFRRAVRRRVAEEHRTHFCTNVGFVDTVIARMVPPPTPKMRTLDPALIAVEPYKELPVDRSGFDGPIPEIAGMQPRDDFGFYTARKLYIHNAGHAMLGYLGYLRGHGFGYQALEDEAIRPLLDKALAESQAGIVAEYGVDVAWLEEHVSGLVRRFANRPLGDPTFRLARDPLRKLRPNDRLVGAARLAEKAGVAPTGLSWGIAGGYCFNSPEDPLAVQLQERIADEGIDAALRKVSGIAPEEPLAALVRERYHRLRGGTWP